MLQPYKQNKEQEIRGRIKDFPQAAGDDQPGLGLWF